MEFSFNQFQFDCEQQVLKKNGEIISLNEKALKLLALFIEQPNKIHAKTDILERVWPDRYVSDQVVFQNISQLRALFGKDAIKTFSKKGYQWQLALTPSTAPSNTLYEQPQSGVETTPDDPLLDLPNKLTDTNTPSEKKPIDKTHYRITLIALLTVFALAWIALTPEYTNNRNSETATVNNDNLSSLFSVVDGKISPKTALHALPSQAVFNSPFASWQKHAKEEDKWLLATKYYEIEQGVVLRFHLQGMHRGWQDYIVAPNQHIAKHQLTALLTTLASSRYLTTSANHAALAELTLLHDAAPDNPLLIRQLIKQHESLDNLDIAIALLDQALVSSSSNVQTGLLELLKAKISAKKHQWQDSKQSAERAIQIFRQTGLALLESEALVESSWFYMTHHEFRQGVGILNKAVTKARMHHEYLQEVNALVHQSFMASKGGQQELAFSLIDMSKALVSAQQLGEQHNIPALSNLAWITKTPDEKMAFYQAILDIPFSPQYQSYFYNAAKRIQQESIKQGDWQKAKATAYPWQRASFRALSNARIAYAQKDKQQGAEAAQRAYRLAQSTQHKIDALDAALLLVIHEDSLEITNEYKNFISQHAIDYWWGQNRDKLQDIGLNKLNKH